MTEPEKSQEEKNLDNLRHSLTQLRVEIDKDLIEEKKEELQRIADPEVAVIAYLKEKDAEWKEKLKEKELKLKEQDTRLKELDRQLADAEGVIRKELPVGFVPSISSASKNAEMRKQYYEKYLQKRPVRGGFVAHRFFIRFVQGARGSNEKRERALQLFQQEANGLVQALQNRVTDSFLSHINADDEGPQSLVASQLLSMALGVWDCVLGKLNVKGTGAHLFVTHEGELHHGNIPGSSLLFSKRGNEKKNEIEYKVDIIANLLSEGKVKVVCAMEYSPDHRDSIAREARRDMSATNIISGHRRPCIGVDIAGGNYVSLWRVQAMAYFASCKESPIFQCSEMYAGTGLEALLDVALGLRTAAAGWADRDMDTEVRMGPVVARHGEKVYKVYDCADYCRPNLDTLQQMLEDQDAVTWQSRDEKLVILTMRYQGCEWDNCSVPSSVFASIIDKLQQLHEDGKVHGDIRLANLLHDGTKGYIIDCDFVHQTKYPSGLLKLGRDGKRHQDVDEAIDVCEDAIASLEMKKEHDVVALAEVMRLFKCDNNESGDNESGSSETVWQSAIELCRSSDLAESAAHLAGRNFNVRMIHEGNLPLFGTGSTPQKDDQRLPSVGEQDAEGK